MSKIRFACFNGTSLLSKAIRFTTRSRSYSHIAWVTGEEQSGKKLIECLNFGHGVKVYWDWSDYSNHANGTQVELWELEVSQPVFDLCIMTFTSWAWRKLEYDWPGILGFIFKRVRGSKEGRFCSEGCIEPLVLSMLWSSINPEHVDPQSFVNIIQAAGGCCIAAGEIKDGILFTN